MPLTPRDVVLRMLKMFATGDLTDLRAVIGVDYQDHQEPDSGNGPEVFALVVTRVRERFLGLRVSVEDIVEQGDRVAVRLEWTGTVAGDGPFVAEGIDIVRVVEGRAREHWGVSRGWPDS